MSPRILGMTDGIRASDARTARAWLAALCGLVLSEAVMAQYYEIKTNTRPTLSTSWGWRTFSDINQNGLPDLIVTNLGPQITIFLDPAVNGIVTPSLWIPMPSAYGAGVLFDIAELDGDGIPDILTSNGVTTFHLLHGNGDGTFILQPFTSISYPASWAVWRLQLQDLNNDGLVDVLVTVADSSNVYLHAYRNIGWPQLTLSWSMTLGYAPMNESAKWDFDGDGVRDLAWIPHVSSYPSGTPLPTSVTQQILVARGDGAGGFNSPMGFPVNVPGNYLLLNHLVLGDMDHDGRADVMVPLVWGTPDLAFLYGNSSTTLSPPIYLTWPTDYGSFFYGVGLFGLSNLFAYDLDMDGETDLIRIGGFGGTQYPWWYPNSPLGSMAFDVLKGTGNRTFANNVRRDFVLPGPSGATFTHGDIDNDGDVDMIGLPGTWPDVVYLENTAILGGSCLGTGGVAPTSAQGGLWLGNGGYYLGINGAAPTAPAVLGVSLGKFPSAACGIQLDLTPGQLILPAGSFGMTTTDSFGSAIFGIPLPNLPALAGTTVYAQWFVADQAGQLGVGAGAYSATSPRTIVLW